MEKNSLLLANDGFASQPSDGCHLLIQITEDSFSYAIIDKDGHSPKVLFSLQQINRLTDRISQAFKDDRFLSLQFQSVKVAIQTSSFLFIPEDLYDDNQKDNYIKFIDQQSEINKHHHPDLSLVTLYELDQELKKLFPQQTVFLPILSPLWISANQHLDSCLLVDFCSDTVNFLYQENGKLIFQNSFSASNAEEFNYFLLLVKQQLNLEKTTAVLMQGFVDDNDEYANCLKRYFLEVSINHIKKLVYNELIDQMPQHYFNTLLAIQLCE